MARFVLGERARSHGDRERATARYTESLALFRAVGDRLMIAWPLGNLGRLALPVLNYRLFACPVPSRQPRTPAAAVA